MAPIKLSACLITRDEEKYLPGCLRSLHGVVDELIVVDTGSTDRTPAIIAEFGADVRFFPWCDDFSAARNEAIRHATGDWIFSIDADERLLRGMGPILQSTLAQAPESIGALAVFCNNPALDATHAYPIKEASHDLDQGSVVTHSVLRLFRNLPGVAFQNRCHETIEPSVKALGLSCKQSAVHIWHEGYRESMIKALDKLERNRKVQEMDLAERPGDPWLHYNMGRTLAALNLYLEAEEQFRIAEAGVDPDATWRPILFRDWEILRNKASVAA